MFGKHQHLYCVSPDLQPCLPIKIATFLKLYIAITYHVASLTMQKLTNMCGKSWKIFQSLQNKIIFLKISMIIQHVLTLLDMFCSLV